MSKKIVIAVIGLGNVGVGVLKILKKDIEILQDRGNCEIECRYISAKNKNKDRGIELSGYQWLDNPLDVINHDDIDIVVELIGGEDGIAYELCKSSLMNGKHIITANKALIANKGFELAKIAEENNVNLYFEAAVAGAIPILKLIKEGLIANQYLSICGILNGTSNYILTEMEKQQKEFESILDSAQKMGYAEAEPSFDVDGIDAGHKIAIITAIAYGVKPNYNNVLLDGIRNIKLLDINFAKKLGYKIKLLAISQKNDNGVIQEVKPVIIDKNYDIAKVDEAFNAIRIKTNNAEDIFITGKGAGELTTASSVIADLMDIVNNNNRNSFNIPTSRLKDNIKVAEDSCLSKYYIRLTLTHKCGVLADITSIFSKNNVSIENILQEKCDNEMICAIITDNIQIINFNNLINELQNNESILNMLALTSY